MRYILFTAFLCGFFFNKTAAQPSFCGAGYSTFFSANIFFGNDLNPTLDGQILPFGSHIIAVFQDTGSWKCAGFAQWNGNTTSMVVNGDDVTLPGYATNEPYKYIVQLPGGCLIDSVTVTYNVSGIYTNPGFFLDGGLSKVASFHAISRDWLALDATNGLCAANTASIAAVATGIGAPFTYVWNNGGNTDIISNLPNGTYTVTTTDAYGCTATETASVSSAMAIEVQLATEQQTGMATCQSQSSVSGGTSPFTYSWSNGQTSSSATNLPPGNFGLTVTDANGCSSTQTDNCMLSDVSDIEGEDLFSVTPNPTNGLVTVEAEEEIDAFSLYDISGRLIQSSNSVKQRKCVLDMGSFLAGEYFLLLHFREKVLVRRVIKH